MESYRNLDAWKRSVHLSVKIINITERFPSRFKFGLCSQIERSVVSVASNIAEGSGRNGTKEYINFLGYAHGSLLELETQIFISNRLKLISGNEAKEIINETSEIGKMIKGLQKSLRKKMKEPDTVTDTVTVTNK